MRWLVLLAFLLNCGYCCSADSSSKDVDIVSPDGTNLRATFYPAHHRGPGVLLLHMCNTTRKSWGPVATLLSAEGINALSVDNRGFGESGGPRHEGASPDAAAQMEKKWPADFDAAYQYLVSQTDVDKSRIGVAGGSCGVNNAIGVAERHTSIKALVLLAGGTDLKGVDFLVNHPRIPIFTAAAADDEYIQAAPELMRWFSEVTGNRHNQFVGFKDGRHGTEIFGVHPELERDIAAFFRRSLFGTPGNSDKPLISGQTQAAEFWKLAANPADAQKAKEMFEAVRKTDPDVVLFPEYVMNLLGYDRIQKGDPRTGLILLKLNSDAYPRSANTWDSLSDAYIANQQTELALAAETKCLEVLTTDPAPNADFKASLRKQAELKIARLKVEKK